MKNSAILIFCLVMSMLAFSVACYQPIANTSGATDSETEKNARNDDTASDISEDKDNNERAQNAAGPEIESMNKNESKDNKAVGFAEGFQGNLSQNLKENNLTVVDIYDSSSPVESRILAEYGSVFLTSAMPPTAVMFTNETEVSAFQTKAGVARANISGAQVELQPAALKALQNAIAEAKSKGLSITPRDKKSNTDSARRSYVQTLELWNSRFFKALEHWKSKGKLSDEQISRLKSLPIKEQVREVLKLEKNGIYFNTFFNGSILQSVAAPGTSQHISMLAFDATEFRDKKVRQILANHGWFRTVQNDEPHFTYLGHKESDLPKLGLKKVIKKDGEFWIPNI